MSAFEFFFSFYGMVLGLSVAVIATGFATAIQHRKSIRIGWLTLLLALFVGLDIATFWDAAWHMFRDAPFSYGMLVVGLAIALVYFIAASLVFPHSIRDGMDLDEHFWANKKVVLLLTVAANLLMLLVSMAQILARPNAMMIIGAYAGSFLLYVALIVPAALTKKPRLFAALVGLHVVIYLAIACLPAGMGAVPEARPATAAAPQG
ncbi:hypothetical protein [Brevundimonas goettingensis]|uniref:Uncharacterized protein n=1 Tax=Brevundimonas goettingensis TaxID=2774190 RepID=A0A975C570_9CAUL|nr:hypothetical protein [Brevundimonas goettingensis]QTC93077.1 hypothetical protein IFJ75_09655 [Brevundimonas goettingensis]